MAVRTDRTALFEALGRLSQAQCESIATLVGMPRERWPQPTASPPDRALAILRFAERQPAGLDGLRKAIGEVSVTTAPPDAGAWERVRAWPGNAVRGMRQRAFRERLIRHVQERCDVAIGPGLRQADGSPLALGDVYIERRLIASPAAQIQPGAPLLDEARTLSEQLERLPEGTALAVVGTPGSGRSTLLARAAVAASRDTGQARLPLLLRLDELAADAITGLPFARVAQRWLDDRVRFPTLKPPAGFVEDTLASGRALVLLDGIDQLPAGPRRARVAEWLEQQVANYPTCRFVIAWPLADDGAPPLSRARVVEMLPVEPDAARRYARAWYEATAGKAGRLGRVELPADAEHALADFERRCFADPVAAALAADPLTLPFLLLLHRHQGALPSSRFALFDGVCDATLDWLDAGNMSVLDKRRAVQVLALAAIERDAADFGADEAQALIGGALRGPLNTTPPPPPVVLPTGLLETLSRSSFVVATAPGRWGVASRAVADYLAAAHWIDSRVPAEEVAARVDDPRWHGALALYAQAGDANVVVDAALRATSASALDLAAACADAVPSLRLANRRAVSERIESELDSAEAPFRRAAASARLSTRIRRLEPIGDQTVLDPDFLTAAEYQLFLDDLGPFASRHRPDHWLAERIPAGEGSRPHLGIRRADAAAFCDWMSRRTGGAYRLPTPDEIQVRTAERNDVATIVSLGPPLGLGREVVRDAVATLARDSRLAIPPEPPSGILSHPLAEEAAGGREVSRRQLESLLAAAVRAAAEPPRAHATTVAGDVAPAIRDLRRLPAPDASDRDAVLEYLTAVHRALGVAADEVPLSHYGALRRHPHLDYGAVLDVLLALLVARDLPRFVDAAAGRGPFDADLDVASSVLRALSYAGARARLLLEARRVGEAAAELRAQITQGPAARDPALFRVASLLVTRLDYAAAATRDAARLVLWWYGSHAAALAWDFGHRRDDDGGRGVAALVGGGNRAYREWADGPLREVYWWAQLVIGRAGGRQRAFEGIRLARYDG